MSQHNIYRAAIAPALVPCVLARPRWDSQDHRSPWREPSRSRSRAVPFLSARSRLIGLGGSFAGYVGPPRARNATLAAVALSGSICPSSIPATRLLARPVQWSSRARPNRTGYRGPCQSARPTVSRIVSDIRSYRPGRYKSLTPDLPLLHATPRHAAKRGVSTSVPSM